MSTTIRSHAKINLGLYLGAPRADGFHSLVTIYQTLELHDLVTITAKKSWEEKRSNIRITSSDERVPADSRNTAWRAVELALENGGTYADVEIHIEKRLPLRGGLGAGSANAAAALLGLEKELGWNKPHGEPRRDEQNPWTEMGIGTSYWPSKRLEIAAEVGSDVPLFLIGGTVLGVDRGQEVYPLPDIESIWCAVAMPAIGVSTPKAFRDWDAFCETTNLTAEFSTGKLKMLSHAYAAAFSGNSGLAGQAGSSGVLSVREDLAGPYESALVRTGIVGWIQNDFEQVVFPQHPSLSAIKRLLAGEGTPEAAILASLSGSGSALFGLYKDRQDAEAAQARVNEQFEGVEVWISRTLPRSRYWREMLLQDVR